MKRSIPYTGLIVILAASFPLATAFAASDLSVAAHEKAGIMRSTQEDLAPHSIMVSSALRGTRVAVDGLASQIATDPTPASPLSKQHIEIYRAELAQDLKTADTHRNELEGAIVKYPDLAKSSEYRDLISAIDDVDHARAGLDYKIQSDSWLVNKDQAQADLKDFKKKLDHAIDKTSNFNSKKLKAQTSFG